ncbi:hypothetical protein WICANDRAFT_35202 [Wickerhamomyces anomalus NRRL Y-366-8]|uniref:Rhodanese domain-containing protein n=1 Tax=Wickerhamomyces anomalus (strain ATCC 58044 / CBS 1984 / NCYC 433 / NRRL Y-366-8) TaxID=683960 RepID=A0A1E3NWD0_WICAA|nr:uncharacterized protein WICANDRAFT_35202 [Wickerhamomyces anomalus NRRL Y-366-8]ODQ57423.1 hypothetical protein WICANDRAFT_35202 [Wickerhamomyces anomalus NRRL Y-366-8]
MSYSVSNLRYIDPQVLRTWFSKGSPTGNGKFSIVDVRDHDYVGGHIKNCLHYPSTNLSETMQEVIEKVKQSDDIVFHCALSQQRGPSAAMKFLRSVQDGDLDGKSVWILRGGFTRWQELYGEDNEVTEGYQKDIWKFGY